MIATVIVQSEPWSTPVLAGVGIVVAGVLGPGVGYWAAARSDRRRFKHEQQLKASDDLIARLDDVAVALDQLAGACANMRSAVLSYDADPDRVWTPLLTAEDAYQKARGLIARLGMRSHADPALLEKARAAADRMLDGIREVRAATIKARLKSGIPPYTDVAVVMNSIEAGYEARREYETHAREAIGNLLGMVGGKPG